MGGGDPEGDAIQCSGADVLKELNDAFSDPNSAEYKYAQNNNTFGTIQSIQGNFQALIDAYNAAGVDVCGNWVTYLTALGNLVPQGPDNIHKIAQARYDGLNRGAPMSTKTHVPKHGGHVHTSGVGAGPITIDSPYDPNVFYRNRNRSG